MYHLDILCIYTDQEFPNTEVFEYSFFELWKKILHTTTVVHVCSFAQVCLIVCLQAKKSCYVTVCAVVCLQSELCGVLPHISRGDVDLRNVLR